MSKVILVVHDWGSALGFHRAYRYPDQIAAIAYMEAVVQPLTWEDFGEARDFFRALRSSAGEHLILDENAFVESVLPGAIMRTLSEEEMATYRAPFSEREARLPTLIWPRQASVDGGPGAVITAGCASRRFCQTWKSQQEVTVRGRHFLKEDSHAEIGGR